MLASNTSAISVARRAAEAKALSDLSMESAIACNLCRLTAMSCGTLAAHCQYNE
jgi:hypothetical protein